MSMVINLVEDHNIYLCEGGPVYNGGVQPTPITYLTQWKIVGNSEVHTLPYPDGVILPTGYKRCEYLTFDGSSYINTGIIPSTGIGCNFSFATNTSGKCILGARDYSFKNVLVFGFLKTNTCGVGYGNSTDANFHISSNCLDNLKHRCILDSEQFKIDDTQYTIDRDAFSTSDSPIYIGTWNRGNTPDYRYYVGNIYDTIIYNTQGELWHGIPCLDVNDTPCFYDLVSQTAFYNQDRGSFTYELYPQPTEIWSCGEYNATDGKYHILVQPQGGSIADIALTEPLRKVNDVADTIEFPSSTKGKALVTRNLYSAVINTCEMSTVSSGRMCAIKLIGFPARIRYVDTGTAPLLCNKMETLPYATCLSYEGIACCLYGTSVYIRNSNIEQTEQAYQNYFDNELGSVNFIYQLATPTTELVDAPQIEEAESYTCVISQGGKAVSWSEFLYYSGYLLTDSENNILVDSENYQLTVQS